ncbi:M48 family metalloprotease, partial [Dissulfurirhabdus thermomarina]|nr:M48 family metalloprotease [Dissulfurirhabdus thermomarina]
RPALSPAAAGAAWILKAGLWWALCRTWVAGRGEGVPGRPAARLEIPALAVAGLDFYWLDAKAHLLALLPFLDRWPSVVEFAGVADYCLHLCLLWGAERAAARRLGPGLPSAAALCWARLRLLLPVFVPYAVLAVAADILDALPWPALHRALRGPWGEAAFTAAFLLLAVAAVPKLVRRFWRCRPLPDGPWRASVDAVLRREGLRFAEVLLWPPGEPGICTAAVLGVVPRWRYLLLTPCLLQALTPAELQAVVAHEAAHVRHRHLLRHLAFLAAFGALLYLWAEPAWTGLLASPAGPWLLETLEGDGSGLSGLAAGLPVLGLFLCYFRFVMGYFMRHFERQADAHVLEAGLDPRHLAGALEKVSALAGGVRDRPNWHHFSIAERVAFLAAAARRPALVAEHRLRLRRAQALFAATALALGTAAWALPTAAWRAAAEDNVFRLALDRLDRAARPPGWTLRLAAELQEVGDYGRALRLYERMLATAPDDPEVLNGLAWLRATADDPAYRDPAAALRLARRAAKIAPAPHVLDTLAEALFRNGRTAEALEVERRALERAGPDRAYYLSQIERFRRRRPPAAPKTKTAPPSRSPGPGAGAPSPGSGRP